MYCVYAVREISGQKHRYYIDVFESLEEAKHVANCYSLGNASYAYVKDTSGGTVFFIRALSTPKRFQAQSAKSGACGHARHRSSTIDIVHSAL